MYLRFMEFLLLSGRSHIEGARPTGGATPTY
jgi:hypothetical protein